MRSISQHTKPITNDQCPNTFDTRTSQYVYLITPSIRTKN